MSSHPSHPEKASLGGFHFLLSASLILKFIL